MSGEDLSQELSLDDHEMKSDLDTLKLVEDPCIEYSSLEQKCGDNANKDILVKTVVKVEQPDGNYQELNDNSVKSLLPNSSINLMIEKYRIERSKNQSSTSFFVTVESFNTILQKSETNDFFKPVLLEESTSLSKEQLEFIRSKRAEQLLVKNCKDSKIVL